MILNSNWKEVELGDLLNFRRGNDLSKTSLKEGMIPVIGSNGIIGYHDTYTTKAPCLTVGRSGNIGKPNYINENCWAHNTTLYVDDFKGNNPLYLYYLLQTLQLSFYGGGSAVPTLNRNHIHPIKVKAISDYNEQVKIANFLKGFDDKIENNIEINDNLEQQAQAIFNQRFCSGSVMGTERALYDFANFINGTSFKSNEYSSKGMPIIKIAELKNGITESTQYFDGTKDNKYAVENGDILFSWSGNPETSIDIFVWTHGQAILNQHTFNVKCYTPHRWFMYLMLKYFKPEFTHIASGKQTTGLGHVTASDLKRLTFVFNEDEMASFEAEITPMMECIYNNTVENQKLNLLRDALLPKLLSGEIDVSSVTI